MKIYKAIPSNVTRLTISRAGEKTIHITLEETTHKDAIDHVKSLLNNVTINILNQSAKLQIVARDYLGGKSLKSKTMSCRGISVKEIEKLIIKSLENGK
jgi:hypothetical protein